MRYAVPVLAPPSGSATMVDCPDSSSYRSGWYRLQVAGRLLDRREFGDLAGLHPHDAEAGELAGVTSTRDSKEPTALLYASTLEVRLRCSDCMCPVMVRNRS